MEQQELGARFQRARSKKHELFESLLAKQFRGVLPRLRVGGRTELGEAPSAIVIPIESLVEREPATVICSAKGWIRVMKGHVEDTAEIKFKEGDRAKFELKCETTDKLLIFASDNQASMANLYGAALATGERALRR